MRVIRLYSGTSLLEAALLMLRGPLRTNRGCIGLTADSGERVVSC